MKIKLIILQTYTTTTLRLIYYVMNYITFNIVREVDHVLRLALC